MANFSTNRSLLNPNFEGYKLSALEQDDFVRRFRLNSKPTQATVSGRTKTPLSFEEVQSRITHNHLSISYDGSHAIYVDEDLKVIRVTVDSVRSLYDSSCTVLTYMFVQDESPSFEEICEIPRTIDTQSQIYDQHHEYPSAYSLPNHIWLVSDGFGLLHVLDTHIEEPEKRIIASYSLQEPSGGSVAPFKIHYSRLASEETVTCVLSSRHTDSSTPLNKQAAQFDLWIASVPLNTLSKSPGSLDIIWHGKGEDVPVWASYDDSRSSFCIAGRGMYRQVDVAPPPSYEPKPEEIAPIPRANEIIPDRPTKPPPYSWTQTSDSVTVAFPLPSNVPKSAIHVTLTAKTVSLLIKHELPLGGFTMELPRFSLKQWWDSISPSTSFWTWDREADKQFGLLTLHLDKAHEGVRWTHVFSTVGNKTSSEVTDPTDIEVPETLDANELHQIREALEKYTNALQTGDDASGLGLGRGMPSLAEGELDEAVDADVGRKFWVTWIGIDGITPSWTGEEGVPSYLLSTPIPGLHENTLVVKNDIDGLLFLLPPALEGVSSSGWKHASTYPALAFVLASKRDTRFIYHVSKKAVLAFESGSSFGSGNLYIYRGARTTENSAKQAILKISGGTSGALLGVGALRRQDQGFFLCCLCEQELVLVKDIL